VIQRQRTGPFPGPYQWQNAFGQLRDDEVVFANAKLVSPDRLDLMIAGNIVETHARDVVMDIVESAIERANGIRLQVDDACSIGGNVGNRYPASVDR
jgi:hypothetical protein